MNASQRERGVYCPASDFWLMQRVREDYGLTSASTALSNVSILTGISGV